MEENVNNPELHEKVVEKIKGIFDPEIPVSIWELGLIYDVKITEQNEVVVLMTLTAPNCPEAGSLPSQVEFDIKEIKEVKDCKVILTFDPPWDKSRLSEAAALELGLF